MLFIYLFIFSWDIHEFIPYATPSNPCPVPVSRVNAISPMYKDMNK